MTDVPKRTSLIWLVVVTWFVMDFAYATTPKPSSSEARASAEATGGKASVGDVTGGNATLNAGDNVLTGGTTTMQGGSNTANVEGSRSYGYGMGDVDINDCYRSWSVPLIQGSQVNPLCLAQQLMAEGNYEAAAVLRCQPKGIYKAFGGRDECKKSLTFEPTLKESPENFNQVDDDDEDYHEAHEAKVAALESRLAKSEEKARKATLEARYAVQEAQKHPETVEYALSEQQMTEFEAWDERWRQ